MSATRDNLAIQGELYRLVGLKVLSFEQLHRLAPRYPTRRWNVASLLRWFTVLGAVSFGAGLLVLVPQVVELQNAIDFGLAAATVGFISGGRVLERARGLPKTGATLQLLGSFALQGLIFALAVRFSTGSSDWPLLIGVCAGACGLLAYLLASRLVLIHALVTAYFAFGAQTGYVSGWGAYWLEMDYPTRYVVAGMVALGLAWVHARWLRGERQGFARVYVHFGLLVVNLALWFFSLFGFYDGRSYDWSDHSASRLAFSALWALFASAALFGGSKWNLRLARGYGLTFLIVDVYTFYFQFVVAKSGDFWFVHLLLTGGSLVALGIWLERRLSARAAVGVPPAGA